MRKVLAIFFSVLLLLSLTACGSNPTNDNQNNDSSMIPSSSSEESKEIIPSSSSEESKKITRGTINGDVYESEYSGLKFTRPESWVYSTDEEIAAAMNVGIEYLGDKFSEAIENNPGIYDMMVVDSLTYSNINISYENLALSFASNITEEQYVEVVKNQLANITSMDIEFSDETETVNLGGNDYLRATLKNTTNGVTMTQAYYLRKIDGYMLIITATIVSGYELADIESMFQ